MQQFIAKFGKDIQGVMSGFDRVLFRGSLRRLTHSLGMKWYLSQNDILCKQYEDHVKTVSQKVKKVALEPFQQQNLLVKHVYGSDDKEKIARAFAVERGITEGDVCALSAMEIAPTFQHYKTDMAILPRPCLTIYHYRIDPEWGWMPTTSAAAWFNLSWIRLTVSLRLWSTDSDLISVLHSCLHHNGREWLARRMDREGLRYVRQANCFPWVEDIPRAQQLFQEQLQVNWTERLQPFARRLNPLHEEIFHRYPTSYYWSSFQCRPQAQPNGSTYPG